MKTSKLWSIVLIFFGFIFIVGISIALPIWIRPFYYMHVNLLDIEEYSGFTREQIITAYNDVLNYLNFGTPFKTGELKISEEATAHFVDCKFLFDLDTWATIIAGLVLIAGLLLKKFKVLAPSKLLKCDWYFYSGLLAIIVPIVLGGAIAIDFDNAFVVFHKIFFPGKENWMFNWYEDEIIRILPSEFFMNCAIFIAAVLFALATACITVGLVKRKKYTLLQQQLKLK